jgi:hypothetical protein
MTRARRDLIVLERAVVGELAKLCHSESTPNTLDEALGNLAEACWVEAGTTLDPSDDERTAQAAIEEALGFAARSQRRFRGALRAFVRGRFVVPGAAKDPLGPRLQRTYSLMATRLWEISVYDTARACAGACVRPGLCGSEGGRACAMSLVFPYLEEPTAQGPVRRNWMRTADAIVRGLARLKLTGELGYMPDRDAVRKALQRLA